MGQNTEMTEDKNVEIARLQNEIGNYIGLGQNSLIFEFKKGKKKVKLHLITVNPRHNQSFLFHSEEGLDKVDALKRMLDHVKNYKDRESSFTIQWTLKGESELHTSYFSAKNVLDALDKLFYGRDPNSVTVFSVMLNPMT